MTSSIAFNVRIIGVSGKWLSCEYEFLNGDPSDEVFMNDALEQVRGDGVIPGSVGIYDSDGTLLADSQIVGFGAVNAVLSLIEIQFLESSFQVIPRFETDFSGGAFRLCRIGTEKNMAADLSNAQICGEFSEMFLSIGTHEFYFALRVWSATLFVAAAIAAGSPR